MKNLIRRKYDLRYRSDRRGYLYVRLSVFLFFAVICLVLGGTYKEHTQAKEIMVPVFEVLETQTQPEPTATPEPEPTPTDLQAEIKAEIRRVFGEDYDKAMTLLQGKGSGTCAENKHLNPEAINDNTTWGGVGQDIGIFQINTHWQGFNQNSVRFLKNYKINIQVAKQIFDESGGNFSRWTCGREFKI
jgi:hypothetical protein